MAKSGTRQDNKKKRDKRRLLRQQANPVRNSWQDLDVSAWFDNTVGFEADVMDVFWPKAEDLPSPIYDSGVPGDQCFSYYASTHPDKKDEAEAVGLVKKLMLFQKNSADEEGKGTGTAKPMLDKLKKLAQAGSVTASAYLGYLYVYGKLIRHNMEKGRELLRYAADNNDPVACFWLSALTDDAEETMLLQKSCESGCPSALFVRLRAIGNGKTAATSAEIDMLAEYQAALASRGSMKNLLGLLHFLSSPCGKELRKEYAPAMLSILDKLAAEDFGAAVHYEAVTYTQGALRLQDATKAAQLYLKAYALGEEQAGLLYATHQLRTVSEARMSRKDKTAKLQHARKVLEEMYESGKEMPRSAGLLGCMLVMSDDDDDFSKGIECLEKSLSEGDLQIVLHAVDNILLWSDDKERHKSGIRLLNSLVRKKSAGAICLRGRYYLDGGLTGNQNIQKGLDMLEQAVAMGYKNACYILAQIYVFGLYNCEIDLDRAEEILKKGNGLRSKECRVLHSLMLLGEFPDCPARLEGRDTGAVLRGIKDNYTNRDRYLPVTYVLAHLNAESQFRKYGEGSEFFLKKLSKQEEQDMVVRLAEDCHEDMLYGNLGPLCYMAYAMGKIGRTKAASLYAGIFAKKLHLPEGTSCDGIADYLYDYVDYMPETYVQYRLKYSLNATDENKPLF